MSKIIFITGGARSGKSLFAVELAKNIGSNVIFIATCAPGDDEMRKRIELHRRNRPRHWRTIEEEKDIPSVLKSVSASCEVIIIDCLTFLLSNLLLNHIQEDLIKEQINTIIDIASRAEYTTIIVSNEVGSGLVPDNALGRRFRDLTGFANQIVVGFACEVYLMVSGIPLKIKEKK